MKRRTGFEINAMLLVWLSELFRIITFKGQFWAGLKWSKLAKLELNIMLVKVVSKVNQESISRPCYTLMLRSDITWINVMVLGGYKLSGSSRVSAFSAEPSLPSRYGGLSPITSGQMQTINAPFFRVARPSLMSYSVAD